MNELAISLIKGAVLILLFANWSQEYNDLAILMS